MGVYKYIRDLWKKPKKSDFKQTYKDYLVEWRKEPVTLRIERPTRLDRARSLGYKAKQGIIIVRQRVKRGGKTREHNLGGRRSKNARLNKIVNKNYKQIAEERANKKYKNLEVLGSYFLAKDGIHVWYEIILVDKSHPQILNDARYNWIAHPSQTGRVYRGKTSAAKESRGLRNKGKGAEKVRPSKKANLIRRGKI